MARSTDTSDSTGAALGEGTARQQAVRAMLAAARALGVEPAALRIAAYRSFRESHEDAGLPSALAISLLFMGWQRACEYAAVRSRDEVAVEAEVIRTLYGDSSGRRRAHDTHIRARRGQTDDTAAGAPETDIAHDAPMLATAHRGSPVSRDGMYV